MKIQLESCELVVAPPGDLRFEAVRERVAPILGGPHGGRDAIRHALVECHPCEIKDGEVCATCSHLLNAVPARDGRSVLVRCVFFESDRVETLMTRAEDVVTVDAQEKISVAATTFLDHPVKQLVVTSEGLAIGLLHARDLAVDGDDLVAQHAQVPLPVVPRTLPLGAMARALREQPLELVGVVDRDELVGVITRGDLRRVGIPHV